MNTLKTATAIQGFLLLAFLLAHCKKEYSYEGGSAVFSFLNINMHCFNPVISGEYIRGSTLGPSNSVQLQVAVTTPGSFSLQTNSLNGFLFSAAGSFSDTGVQTLTLNANGRPDSTGEFSFTPDLPGSCSFVVEVTGQPVQEADYTITGAPDACTNVLVSGLYQSNKLLTDSNKVVVNVNVADPGDYIIHTDTLDGISFYASGHFTQTGVQAVTLMGSGTPALPQDLRFTLAGNSSSCTFPLSVKNSGDPATYVIASGLDHCVGAIAGAYTAGTAMNASNTYTLTVYVTVVGSFSISTQTVDGVNFSYSGTFTTLGTQWVTLKAKGIPVSIGNFTMTPEIIGPAPLGAKSCDFTMPVK